MQSYLTNCKFAKQLKTKFNVNFNVLAEYVFGKQFVYSRGYGATLDQAIAIANDSVRKIQNTQRTDSFYESLSGKKTTPYHGIVEALISKESSELDVDIEVWKFSEKMAEQQLKDYEEKCQSIRVQLGVLRKESETLQRYKDTQTNFILIGSVVTHPV